MISKKYLSLLATAGILLSLAVAVPAFAQSNQQGGGGRFGRGMMGSGQAPAVVGTVSAVSGNSITVNGKQGFSPTATLATYTVDATNAKITKNNTVGTISSIVVGDTIAVQGTVSGTNITATSIRDGVMMGGGLRGLGVTGTVSSISGTTIMVAGKTRPNGAAATTYTVDASSATVIKNGQTSAVSNIAVGDTVMVQGTITGTNVAAKNIRDGVPPQMQSAIQGNGQPVVAGKVTLISGNSITITNNSNVTYTVDATGAKFVVSGITSPSISNVAVGDNLVIQGTVSGNSVTASSVIDQKAKANGGSTGNNSGARPNFMGGMMNGIGNFFKHLFGF